MDAAAAAGRSRLRRVGPASKRSRRRTTGCNSAIERQLGAPVRRRAIAASGPLLCPRAPFASRCSQLAERQSACPACHQHASRPATPARQHARYSSSSVSTRTRRRLVRGPLAAGARAPPISSPPRTQQARCCRGARCERGPRAGLRPCASSAPPPHCHTLANCRLGAALPHSASSTARGSCWSTTPPVLVFPAPHMAQ
jgi:hypothetical protein